MEVNKVHQKFYQISLLLLIIGSSYLFVRTIYTQYEIITFPYQMEYHETVLALAVELMDKGGNPYKIEYQPEYAQAYSIVRELIHYPFVKIFGSSLQIHRFVTALGTLLSFLVLVNWLIDLKVNKIVAICSSLILYISLIFWQLGINRPDSWALFFMLLSVYIPFKYNYSYRSLIWSIIWGMLAFYTKSYFVLGSVAISSFMFFFISKKKGLFYIFSFLLFFFITIYIVSSFFPLFFYLTILSFLNYSIGGDISYANYQLVQYSRINIPILALLCIILAYSFFFRKNIKKITFNWRVLNMPILVINESSLVIVLQVYLFLFMLCIIHYFLGRNVGAYLNYYFTHITPFLLLLVIPLIGRTNKLISSLAFVLILLNVWNARKALFTHKINEQQVEQWEIAKKYVQEHSNILGTPAMANLIKERGMKVYEQGLLMQFVYAGRVEKPLLKKIFPRYKQIQEVSKEFDNSITKKIENKEFDLIALPSIHPTIASDKNIELYYEKVDSVTLDMPFVGHSWKTTFWKPK